MSYYKEPGISYEIVAADSGYLSDLVETAYKSNAVAARQLESSSTFLRSSQLIMSTFDDTQWDIKATGAKLALINKACRLLAKRAKKPTRFPIVPLPSTLDRARARAKLRQQRVRRAEFVHGESTAGAHRVEEIEVADGYGRTRAASRIIGGLGATMGQSARVSGEEQEKSGLRRKRSQ